MALVLTAAGICEQALRQIGHTPITETAPDGEALRVALQRLDLILAETGAVTRFFAFVPATLTLTLVAGQSAYPLETSLGSQFPTDDIESVIAAYLLRPDGRREPIVLAQRDTWQGRTQESREGVPEILYVNRLPSATLYTYPTLPAAETETYQLALDVQTYAPKVSPGGVTGNRPLGSGETRIRQGWQRWLIYRLAMDIGSGPVAWLQEQRISRLERQAAIAWDALTAFENRPHDTEPPMTHPMIGWDH